MKKITVVVEVEEDFMIDKGHEPIVLMWDISGKGQSQFARYEEEENNAKNNEH